MSLVNCKKRRKTCGGPIVSSTCISYEGEYSGALVASDFDCNANLDDVIEKLSEIVGEIKSSIDLSSFDKKCLVFDKTTQKVKDLLQVQTDKLCQLEGLISLLKLQVDNLTAANLLVTMDLGCLAGDASPCEVTPKTYTLLSILQLFKNEICLLKS